MTFAKVQQSGWDKKQDDDLLKLLGTQDKKDADAREQDEEKKKKSGPRDKG